MEDEEEEEDATEILAKVVQIVKADEEGPQTISADFPELPPDGN